MVYGDQNPVIHGFCPFTDRRLLNGKLLFLSLTVFLLLPHADRQSPKQDQDGTFAPTGQARRLSAPLASGNELVISHGNGPQVGVLALESVHDPNLSRPYPFDVPRAQTQGMIGYWLA